MKELGQLRSQMLIGRSSHVVAGRHYESGGGDQLMRPQCVDKVASTNFIDVRDIKREIHIETLKFVLR